MKTDVHDPFGEKESCLERKVRKYSLRITKKRSNHKNFFKANQGFSKVAFLQRLCLCKNLCCGFCAFCFPFGKAKSAETATSLPGRLRRPEKFFGGAAHVVFPQGKTTWAAPPKEKRAKTEPLSLPASTSPLDARWSTSYRV